MVIIDQLLQVHSIDISQQPIILCASSDDVKVISDHSCRMKSTLFGSSICLIKLYPAPLVYLNIEGPQIIEIFPKSAFPSEYYKVGMDKLAGMICPFPGSFASLWWNMLTPSLSGPIEEGHRVWLGFVVWAPPEEDDLVVDVVKVKGEIRPTFRESAWGWDALPGAVDYGKTPYIFKVLSFKRATSKATKKYQFIGFCSYDAVSPAFSRNGQIRSAVWYLFPLHL